MKRLLVASLLIGAAAPFVLDCSDAGVAGGAALATPDASFADSADVSVTAALDGGDAGRRVAVGTCRPVVPGKSAQPIPARLAVTATGPATLTRTMYVQDMFNDLRKLCGSCHVDGAQGGFQARPENFRKVLDRVWLGSMQVEDQIKIMPPIRSGGKLPSQRDVGDSTNELVTLMQAWLEQGKPAETFELPLPPVSDPERYRLSDDIADRMTNIGDCIPDPGIVGTEVDKMRALDDTFAAMYRKNSGTLIDRIGLPERLEDTDFFTLDTETLARHGVVAYAPAYPVFTDGAMDQRYVRVPLGTSIEFDETTQQFKIPEDTRLYRTVLKQVVDPDGVQRWRKMETRLVVVRNDSEVNGVVKPQAVAGTYAWSEDETQALLVTDPLRDGTPFRDRLITYVADEPAAKHVAATKPVNLTYAYDMAHVLHRYGIPGRQRCRNCHTGSSSKDYVLGFTPLQISRRKLGEGGTIEPAGEDELTQLQRFIDYGVITKVASPSAIRPLEQLQGMRAPRNNAELVAQGYLVANCASCHNPRGIASVQNPDLKTTFDLEPSQQGGIFQFPLDRMSMRITRDYGGSVPMPYITPSLVDFPWYPASSAEAKKLKYRTEGLPDDYMIFAPWRSLLYRSVDTPFIYSEDATIIPHMPMDSPGFDCRLPAIMGDWMVGIAGTLPPHPEIAEYNTPPGAGRADYNRSGGAIADTTCFNDPQTYTDVKPGALGYEQAAADAKTRLDIYHTGHLPEPKDFTASSWIRDGHQSLLTAGIWPRYQFCPDTSDIVDPAVIYDPVTFPTPPDRIILGPDGNRTMPRDGVPDRAHWMPKDETVASVDWYPRRADWDAILVAGRLPPDTDRTHRDLVDRVRAKTVTQALRTIALTERPMGLWLKKPGCNFRGVPTVSQLAKPTPRWLDTVHAAPDAPVYMMSAGAYVYQQICSNCHGERGDSGGREASNLNEMTGGNARVTNLVDGLFGPLAAPGANRNRIFGPFASTVPSPSVDAGADGGTATGTTDDWAARYFTWMALGGTAVTIPPDMMTIIKAARIFGQSRSFSNQGAAKTGNMLYVANDFCRILQWMSVDQKRSTFSLMPIFERDGTLITVNGDRELWEALCAVDNTPLAHVATCFDTGTHGEWQMTVEGSAIDTPTDVFDANRFPSDQRVGTMREGVYATGIAPDNMYAWCARRPPAAATDCVDDVKKRVDLPLCPAEVASPTGGGGLTNADLERIANLGAINAGLVAFVYMDAMARGTVGPKPTYDRCEQLSADAGTGSP